MNEMDARTFEADYRDRLENKLTFNSHPLIAELTKRARTFKQYSHIVVQLIVEMCDNSRDDDAMRYVFLMDSILKNVRDDTVYLDAFSGRVVQLFIRLYDRANDRNKRDLRHVLKTWAEGRVFNESILAQIIAHGIIPESRKRSLPMSMPSAPSAKVQRTSGSESSEDEWRRLAAIITQKRRDLEPILQDLHKNLHKRVIIDDAVRILNSALAKPPPPPPPMQQPPPQPPQQHAYAVQSSYHGTAGDWSASVSATPIPPPLSSRQVRMNMYAHQQPQPPQQPQLHRNYQALKQQQLQRQQQYQQQQQSLQQQRQQMQVQVQSHPRRNVVGSYKSRWSAAALKRDPIEAVSELYNPRCKQCKTCGLRRLNELDFQDHLDWHFRMSEREKRRKKQTVSQQWYLPSNEWLEGHDFYSDSHLKEENITLEHMDDSDEEIEEVKENVVMVNEDDDNAVCPVCQEAFDTFWDDDKDAWMYRKAVKFDGQTIHEYCVPNPDDDDDDVEMNDGSHTPPPQSPLMSTTVTAEAPLTPKNRAQQAAAVPEELTIN